VSAFIPLGPHLQPRLRVASILHPSTLPALSYLFFPIPLLSFSSLLFYPSTPFLSLHSHFHPSFHTLTNITNFYNQDMFALGYSAQRLIAVICVRILINCRLRVASIHPRDQHPLFCTYYNPTPTDNSHIHPIEQKKRRHIFAL